MQAMTKEIVICAPINIYGVESISKHLITLIILDVFC